MSTAVRAAVLAAIVFVAAGCASQNQPESQVQRTQPTDPGYGPIIGDVKDARTRAKAHTDLAAAYYELGNLGVALEEARIALAADPTYPPAYNVQGLVNMELRDQAGADASFQRGLKLAPQDPDLNHNYGWFLCQTGREQQSIQWFMNAIKNPLYPTPSKSYAAAGRCLQKGNPAESAQYLERALRLDPNTVQAMMPYAEYLYRRGQLVQAKELVGRYNKMLPEPTPESLWLALRIERKLGDRLAEASFATQLRRRYSNSNEYQSLLRGDFD
ncbi:MAG: type IV pilus biogenesis/stability protein PilW [Bacteroidota bacterium]|jgi:type IV pilus assembly protein PilF